MEKIYILDAVNYLFRSYYAIGPMLNAKGESTSALFGFIRSVRKLIKDFAPTHFVCVFDGPDNKKARQQVYAEYKMNRKGAPEDLFPQFEWAYKYCDLAGIPTLCIVGCEADDTMAAVAIWAEKQGAEVFLCSSDKDLMQLINDQVKMLQLHKDNLIIDEKKVVELFGVKPSQMLDLLAMMGDASDNIPGLKGFGLKTSAALLQEFGSLDFILAHPEKVKGEKKQETLRTGKKEALMSRELATLQPHLDIPKKSLFYEIKEPKKDQLSLFFQEMNFSSFLKEMKVEKPSSSVAQYILIDKEEDLKKLLSSLKSKKSIAIDTETTELNPLLAKIVGVGLAAEPEEAYYIPFNGPIKEKTVVKLLQEFFKTTSASFYGHNLKYDYQVLANYDIKLQNIDFDTLLASYILAPQNRKHNLDDLSLEKFEHVKIPIEDLIGKGKKAISMSEVAIDTIKDYCCEDVDYTMRLKELFKKELKEKKLENLLEKIELPLLPILANMEREGIFLDKAQLSQVGKTFLLKINALKKEIYNLVGEEFNLNSPKQLSAILFEKLKLKSPTKSTSADILEELIDSHPVIAPILEYRTLEKLRSTYIEALPLAINPKTNRIHCTFNQSVTATGRLSSQNPNLQNIPIESKIRACFKPKEGHSFVGADYSQIELRLLAHFSQDPSLSQAFFEKRDIHTHTASLIFDVNEAFVTEEMRRAAKTVNFGIVYGQSAFGLSKQLRIPYKEASHFIKTYFERYPKVQDYLKKCKEKVKELGYSETLSGRIRPIPEIYNKNPSIRNAAERLAVNTPLQGTAADLIKEAMIEIDKEIKAKHLTGKMILQIHDELIFEVPDHEVKQFLSLVKKNMEEVTRLKVPIEVHLAVGKNWAEC